MTMLLLTGLTMELSRAERARSAAREVHAVSADGRAEGVHRRLERRVRRLLTRDLQVQALHRR